MSVATVVRMSRPEQVLLILVVLGCGYLAGDDLRPVPAADGATDPLELAWCAAAVALVAVSVHIVNEYADVGTDALTRRTAFSGGSGALVDSDLPASFALRWALGSGAAASAVIAAGAALSVLSPTATVMLAVGLVGGWQYSVGPLRLSRRGLGETANAFLGGLLLPATGAVVTGAAAGPALLAFLPFALLDFVNLLETQWADREADRAVGKHTLASRLSPRALRRCALITVAVAYPAAFLVQPTPVALAGLCAVPLTVVAVRRMGDGPPGPAVAAMVVHLVAQGTAWALL